MKSKNINLLSVPQPIMVLCAYGLINKVLKPVMDRLLEVSPQQWLSADGKGHRSVEFLNMAEFYSS